MVFPGNFLQFQIIYLQKLLLRPGYIVKPKKYFVQTTFHIILSDYLSFWKLVHCWFNSYDGGPYHIKTSPLICSASQWTGFYMIGSSVMKELILKIGLALEGLVL